MDHPTIIFCINCSYHRPTCCLAPRLRILCIQAKATGKTPNSNKKRNRTSSLDELLSNLTPLLYARRKWIFSSYSYWEDDPCWRNLTRLTRNTKIFSLGLSTDLLLRADYNLSIHLLMLTINKKLQHICSALALWMGLALHTASALALHMALVFSLIDLNISCQFNLTKLR